MTKQEILNLILLLSPILIVQIGLAVYALVDLKGREHIRGERWVWACGLILTSVALPTGIIVSGLYLAWGRHSESTNDPH